MDAERKSAVVNIRLDAETLAQVEAVAAAEGRSRSNMFVQLIKAALEARPRKRDSPRSAEMKRRAAKRKKKSK
jgi:metal-responsive CopG/Arc/MetJ family transcriptional regulator